MLPFDTAAALVSFGFVSSITPGPNNLMLASSGATFGLRRTLPHMLGVVIGFSILLLAVGFGLGAIFVTVPVLRTALKIAGAAYMLFLAWRMATAVHVDAGDDEEARPMTFLEAAAFQWVNPKGWVMALSSMAIFVRPDHALADVPSVVALFSMVNVPAVLVWASFGFALGSLLREPRWLRLFNITMAVLLVASILPMVRD